MPAVFVHGNPETTAVWEPLLAELAGLRSDLICLSPPGFGAPLPAGFDATQAGYRDWLVQELTALGEPVDLVGHDWGGGHVVNVVLSRPDLVRSWVSDVLGIYDPGYRWHELARLWQTPDVGEADVVARFGGTAEERARVLAERGMGRQVAARVAAGQDPRRAERSSRCTARPRIRASPPCSPPSTPRAAP
jgi:pimeloyl-ACP methyl ester carboxylesterase